MLSQRHYLSSLFPFKFIKDENGNQQKEIAVIKLGKLKAHVFFLNR